METEIEAENPTQANPSRDVDLMTLVLRLRAGHIPRPSDSELTMEEAADVIESLLARLKVIAPAAVLFGVLRNFMAEHMADEKEWDAIAALERIHEELGEIVTTEHESKQLFIDRVKATINPPPDKDLARRALDSK